VPLRSRPLGGADQHACRGFGAFPVRVAKTQKSLSDDPYVVGCPEAFDTGT